MGLSVEQFGWMTPFEFYYRRKHAEQQESLVLHKVRLIIAELYNSSGFATKRVQPSDVFKVPLFDGEAPVFKIPTVEEERDEIKEIFARLNGNGNN